MPSQLHKKQLLLLWFVKRRQKRSLCRYSKKPFQELGLLVRIINDFFAQCRQKKKKTEAPMEEFRLSGIERK
jgi:hypothetical protein